MRASLRESCSKKNQASAQDFLESVENEKRREDSFAVLDFMKEVAGEEPMI